MSLRAKFPCSIANFNFAFFSSGRTASLTFFSRIYNASLIRHSSLSISMSCKRDKIHGICKVSSSIPSFLTKCLKG
uniref:Uncharacterized protein n=1 Tax=Lepeophtheirus salmonis TaxID=72036 RepID=A0A0K2UZ78_LEPSM